MISACIQSCRNAKRGAKPWHELLTYETSKRVKIKDPVIGVLRLVLIIACFVYFCVFRIFGEYAFYKTEKVTGIIQTSLQGPPGFSDTWQDVRLKTDYCNEGYHSTKSNLPCVTGPDAWVMAPSEGGDELFIATRLKDTSGDGKQVTRSFVLNPEDYTVGVTFTVQALQFWHDTRDAKFSKSITEVTTRLVDKESVPYTSGVTRLSRFDIFTVSTLLDAAGIKSLDDPHALDPTKTNRYEGLTLLLNVGCSMEMDGTFASCDYQVDHFYGSVAETFIVKSYNSSGESGISTQERRGILIKFKASGEMGRFDLSTFMLAWVSSLALVEICTMLIDWSMTYLLPYRGIYKMVLYDESPNIHELRQGDKKAGRAVKNLRLKKLAISGEVNAAPSGLVSPTGSTAWSQGSSQGRPSPASRASPRGVAPVAVAPQQDYVSPRGLSDYSQQVLLLLLQHLDHLRQNPPTPLWGMTARRRNTEMCKGSRGYKAMRHSLIFISSNP